MYHVLKVALTLSLLTLYACSGKPKLPTIYAFESAGMLDTIISGFALTIYSTDSMVGESSELVISRPAIGLLDTVTITKGSLYKYHIADLNEDGINDVILSFAADEIGAYVLLLHDTAYQIFFDYGHSREIYPIILNKQLHYATYKLGGCADAVWESELLAFALDTFSVRYRYEADWCSPKKGERGKESLIKFKGNDSSFIKLHHLTESIDTKDVQELWTTLSENGHIFFK